MQFVYDMEKLSKLGKRLKALRQSQQITQEDMSKVLGISKNHISILERGVNKISLEVLIGYCRKLDMTPGEILEYPESDSVPPELIKLYHSLTPAAYKKLLQIGEILSKDE